MTLEEYLKLSGPDRKKGSGLLLIKVLAFGDQQELFKLKAEFMVHLAELRKRHRDETDAIKKGELELALAALDYANEVIEVAPAVRENFEQSAGFRSDKIRTMYADAQRDFERLLRES